MKEVRKFKNTNIIKLYKSTKSNREERRHLEIKPKPQKICEQMPMQ